MIVDIIVSDPATRLRMWTAFLGTPYVPSYANVMWLRL